MLQNILLAEQILLDEQQENNQNDKSYENDLADEAKEREEKQLAESADDENPNDDNRDGKYTLVKRRKIVGSVRNDNSMHYFVRLLFSGGGHVSYLQGLLREMKINHHDISPVKSNRSEYLNAKQIKQLSAILQKEFTLFPRSSFVIRMPASSNAAGVHVTIDKCYANAIDNQGVASAPYHVTCELGRGMVLRQYLDSNLDCKDFTVNKVVNVAQGAAAKVKSSMQAVITAAQRLLAQQDNNKAAAKKLKLQFNEPVTCNGAEYFPISCKLTAKALHCRFKNSKNNKTLIVEQHFNATAQPGHCTVQEMQYFPYDKAKQFLSSCADKISAAQELLKLIKAKKQAFYLAKVRYINEQFAVFEKKLKAFLSEKSLSKALELRVELENILNDLSVNIKLVNNLDDKWDDPRYKFFPKLKGILYKIPCNVEVPVVKRKPRGGGRNNKKKRNKTVKFNNNKTISKLQQGRQELSKLWSDIEVEICRHQKNRRSFTRLLNSVVEQDFVFQTFVKQYDELKAYESFSDYLQFLIEKVITPETIQIDRGNVKEFYNQVFKRMRFDLLVKLFKDVIGLEEILMINTLRGIYDHGHEQADFKQHRIAVRSAYDVMNRFIANVLQTRLREPCKDVLQRILLDMKCNAICNMVTMGVLHDVYLSPSNKYALESLSREAVLQVATMILRGVYQQSDAAISKVLALIPRSFDLGNDFLNVCSAVDKKIRDRIKISYFNTTDAELIKKCGFYKATNSNVMQVLEFLHSRQSKEYAAAVQELVARGFEYDFIVSYLFMPFLMGQHKLFNLLVMHGAYTHWPAVMVPSAGRILSLSYTSINSSIIAFDILCNSRYNPRFVDALMTGRDHKNRPAVQNRMDKILKKQHAQMKEIHKDSGMRVLRMPDCRRVASEYTILQNYFIKYTDLMVAPIPKDYKFNHLRILAHMSLKNLFVSAGQLLGNVPGLLKYFLVAPAGYAIAGVPKVKLLFNKDKLAARNESCLNHCVRRDAQHNRDPQVVLSILVNSADNQHSVDFLYYTLKLIEYRMLECVRAGKTQKTYSAIKSALEGDIYPNRNDYNEGGKNGVSFSGTVDARGHELLANKYSKLLFLTYLPAKFGQYFQGCMLRASTIIEPTDLIKQQPSNLPENSQQNLPNNAQKGLPGRSLKLQQIDIIDASTRKISCLKFA